MKTRTMRKWSTLVLMSLITMSFLTACGDDEVSPSSDPNAEAKLPSTDLQFYCSFPSNILSLGDVIVSYNDVKTDETVVKTLTNEDFSAENGKNIYRLSIHHDFFAFSQQILVKFQPKTSYELNIEYFFSAKTKDKDGNNVADYRSPLTLPIIADYTIGSDSNPKPQFICGMVFDVDANGNITATTITEDDLNEEQFTEEQNAYLSDCVSRLLSNASVHSSDILQMLPNEGEETIDFGEQIPEEVFGKAMEVKLSIEPYSDMIIFSYKVKTNAVTIWNISSGAIRVNELEQTLNSENFHKRGVRIVRRLVMEAIENDI